MVNPVGFRFRPTDEEIVDHYLRPKNLEGNTSHVDEVISTVDICSFDPWELPSQSKMESTEQVWFFFGCKKEQQHSRGDRQSRKTKTGFWKKTGVTMDITRKRVNREKIGEKRVLVFHYSKAFGGFKSDWVMHEYVATVLSPTQVTYTFCKVMFKGDERELSPSSVAASGIMHSHSLMVPHGNDPVGLSTETEGSSLELQNNPNQFWGILDEQQETGIFEDYLIDFDDDEQRKIMFVQENRSVYRPKQSQTGVFTGHSSDDSDSDSISATTSSIQTSSTCDSFGDSNHRIDQNTDLQESPSSTIELVSNIDTSEKKMNPYDDAQGSEIRGDQMGQEMIKNKRAGFIYRMMQKFTKKFQLCCSVSRT
ncbi:unnamed protein product [Thlaspi arvense]|uniref:NAC domain-containing protein n=1 Tax=Thlaspi arvense TaxID=13288 RepID=A0AAU9RER1_THLAR|nr:unnamed protein product [Thlaspi arvense]